MKPNRYPYSGKKEPALVRASSNETTYELFEQFVKEVIKQSNPNETEDISKAITAMLVYHQVMTVC